MSGHRSVGLEDGYLGAFQRFTWSTPLSMMREVDSGSALRRSISQSGSLVLIGALRSVAGILGRPGPCFSAMPTPWGRPEVLAQAL